VDVYLKDRNIIEIPLPVHFRAMNDGYLKWQEQLETVFFFSNQKDVFDCYLISLNKEIFVNYNTKNTLSFNFTQWMLKTLPKNVRDKKKRFYKP
jgi:hypothetical protein